MIQIEKLYFIDDSDDEAFLSQVMFNGGNIKLEIVHYPEFANFFDDFRTGTVVDLKTSLIIVDFNLTVMNGADGIRQIRASESLQPVCAGICSGSEDPADRKSALDAGADFFAPKPLDKACLNYICSVVPSLEFSRLSSGESILHQAA